MVFTPDEITARLRERPFPPLRIVLTTGEYYDVYHPDLVFVGRRSLMIGFPAPDDPYHYDQVTRVALAHVVELRELPMPPTPPAANGHPTS
jgi:hypothetical protein